MSGSIAQCEESIIVRLENLQFLEDFLELYD